MSPRMRSGAFRAAAIASAVALAGCAGMDAHRSACAALLGRPAAALADDKPLPGGPAPAPEGAKPAPLDPAVEQCAQRRADDERAVAAVAVLGVLAAGIAGAAYGAGSRSAYRPSYRRAYAPAYRPAWRRP